MNFYNGYKGFAILKLSHDLTVRTLQNYAEETGVPLRILLSEDEPLSVGYIPVGSLEWIQKALGKTIIPDYYPDWCAEYFHRHIWKSDVVPVNGMVFVKSAKKYESIIGTVVDKNSAVNIDKWADRSKVECWCSDKVEFTDAFRYYVTAGKVVAYGQVSGSNADVPKLPIKPPTDWNGALDFGHFNTGEFALIEASYPTALSIVPGFSTRDFEKYLQWLIDGWIYLNK